MAYWRRSTSQVILVGMKLWTTVGLLLLALAMACGSRPLKLRRVVLYQNGVGHFEHSGKVSKEKLRFFVKDYEVDDVLKTLTVVSQDGVTMTPTVHTATVDEPPRGVAPVVAKADAGEGSAGAEVGGDEKNDSRTAIDVILRGGRGTNVSVSYAVPTPAWRATYRVVLPQDGKGKTLLQGWAALQNTSDEDWENVELVLATGAPFTYAIDLHSPRFVARPDLSGKLVRPANLGKVGASRARPEDAPAQLDSDQDRILDSDDLCPNAPETYNGVEDEDGCPDRGRVVVTDTAVNILDKIYFARGSALIRKRSKPILDAIIATLQGNPDIQTLEIQGHTSDDERNPSRLARQRADAVAAALVEGGISHRRLRVRSYGASNPVDPRKTASAREKNRRVEFLILARDSDGGGASKKRPASRSAPVTTRRDEAEVAKATDLAGTVRYKLPVRVSVPRGQSTLVPIVNRHVEGREIYLYRPDSSAPGSDSHPFRAARIVNTGGFELPSGPMAIFARGSFVGEGVLDKLFAGESAYIPYALDSSSTVDRESKTRVRPSRLLSIRAGVAEVEDYQVRTTRYQIDIGKTPPAILYVDHRVMSGYQPYRIPDGTDRSHGGLLVPVPLRPSSPAVVELMERRAQTRRIALARWQSGSIADYLEDPRLPAGIAKGLREVVRLRAELAKVDEAQSKANERRYRLLSRANQIRANLQAIGKSAPKLRKRLLAELAKLDGESKALLAEVTRQDERRARMKAELSELVQTLDWTPE